jgi:hypothetical protein
VLVLDEGASASQVLGISRGPVRTLIVGVVDLVTLGERAGSQTRPSGAPPPPSGGPPGETPGGEAIQDGTRG